MMSPSIYPKPYEILSTKLEIPCISPRILQRNRLTRLLQNGLGRRITLIVAPTGYGKTTLLSEWVTFLATTNWRTAWVSLDSFDNTPLRLWSYITSALHKAYPKLNFNPSELLHEGYDPLDFSILHPLFNEIASIPFPICLILDDYQEITQQSIHSSIAYLIEHQPANLHLVLASRSTPPISLARLRAQNQVLDISFNDLAFNFSETSNFLSDVMALDLSPSDAQVILDNTEGWIIGLQLIALSCQHRSDCLPLSSGTIGTNHQILDYLVEEILDHLPLHLQEFLLRTSILSELSASLCDSVLEWSDSRDCLTKLEQANLFIVCVDEKKTWFRYHRLFAEAMQDLLQQKEPNLVQILHQRACNWLLTQGYPEKAVAHSLAANDLERAAEILDSFAMDALIKFDGLSLSQWVSRFSNEMIINRPQLGIYKILFASRYGPINQVEFEIKFVEDALNEKARNHISAEQEHFIKWELEAVKALFESVNNNPEDTISRYQELLRIAPTKDTFIFGAMSHNLGGEYEISGRLDSAIDLYEEGIQFAINRDLPHEYVYSYCRIAGIRKIQGKLNEAEKEYQQQLSCTQKTGLDHFVPLTGLLDIAIERQKFDKARLWVSEIIENLSGIEKRPSSQAEYESILACIARFFISQRDYSNAQSYLDMARRSLGNHIYPSEYPILQIIKMQVALNEKTGELPSAVNNLIKEINPLSNVGLSLTTKQAMLARIELAFNRSEPALVLLKEMDKFSRNIGAHEFLLESLILQALAYHQLEQDQPALVAIHEAVNLAAAEDYVNRFVAEGKPIKELLEKYIRSDEEFHNNSGFSKQIEYAERILTFIDQDNSNIAIKPPKHTIIPSRTSPLDEPLSTREIEVLILLVKGKSMKEVAASLMISENTLKTHTKRIFRKLGTHNRAILHQHAIELGLHLE